MKFTKDIKLHDSLAKKYDALSQKSESHIHEIFFDMCCEYIQPKDCLLDIGIGTGLSSMLFAKAGLIIYGLDGSKKMLKECEKKGFAKELRQFNIQDTPLPYADNNFSHIISCGVLHSFADLRPIIKQVQRILKPEGIFAFSIASLAADTPDYIEVETGWDSLYYKHSDNYIKKSAAEFSFKILKEQNTFSKSDNKDTDDFLLKIFVTQK